jgi:hypothetical protein
MTCWDCNADATHTNGSGHHYCDIHFAQHEATMALGFARRIRDNDSRYLVGYTQEAIANLRAMLDSIEAALPEQDSTYAAVPARNFGASL